MWQHMVHWSSAHGLKSCACASSPSTHQYCLKLVCSKWAKMKGARQSVSTMEQCLFTPCSPFMVVRNRKQLCKSWQLAYVPHHCLLEKGKRKCGAGITWQSKPQLQKQEVRRDNVLCGHSGTIQSLHIRKPMFLQKGKGTLGFRTESVALLSLQQSLLEILAPSCVFSVFFPFPLHSSDLLDISLTCLILCVHIQLEHKVFSVNAENY